MHDTLDRELSGVPATSPRPPSRRRGWVRPILVFMIGALLASVSGFLVSDHVSQDEKYDRLRATLSMTRHDAGQQTARLVELRHAVGTLLSQVKSDTAAWSLDTTELKAAYVALVLTQANVSQQNNAIAGLHNCLGGVRQALNELGINDQAGAVSSLDSVATSCSAASGT